MRLARVLNGVDRDILNTIIVDVSRLVETRVLMRLSARPLIK